MSDWFMGFSSGVSLTIVVISVVAIVKWRLSMRDQG